jgi:hypothetical protein
MHDTSKLQLFLSSAKEAEAVKILIKEYFLKE